MAKSKLIKLFDQLKAYQYDSFGFPIWFLSYSYIDNTFSVTFRNPRRFKNPDTKSKTPEDACEKMLEYLKSLK